MSWTNEDFFTGRLEQRVFEQRRVGASVTSSMRVEVQQDMVMDQLVTKLEAYVLTDHLADDTYTGHITVETPASTWQMFKSKHGDSRWLRWLVERWPVQMDIEQREVVIKVERYLNYPEANLRLPELGAPVIFETVRQVEP